MEKTKRVGRNLTEGPIFPLLISFALPMILTNLIQQCYSIADLMIIGKFVGSVGTVGVSTGGELSDLMTPLASGFSVAGQIYIAQLVGARNHERLKTVISTLLTLMMTVAFAILAAALVFHRQILVWLNCPEEAFASATSYLMITTIGMPFIFGYNAICAILRGMGESKRPLMFVIVAATVNIFLDLLLVAVFHMEAEGTAIATVASQIGAFVASALYLYRRRETLGLEFKLSFFRVNPQDLAILLKLGIPQMVRVICVQSAGLWMKSSVNSYGLVASATYSVGNKIEKFVNIFVQSMEGAGGAMLGQNIGARKFDRVKESMGKMILFSLAMAAAANVLFLVAPRPLYRLFTNDPEVIEFGVVFLHVMIVTGWVHALSAPAKAISTGAGAAGLSLTIGILDAACRVLFSLLFLHTTDLGVVSFFWGVALCQLIPAIICFAYYFSGKWKTKRLLTER